MKPVSSCGKQSGHGHIGRVLLMDASSFAIPEATMDKMTFLVDKLPFPQDVTCVE